MTSVTHHHLQFAYQILTLLNQKNLTQSPYKLQKLSILLFEASKIKISLHQFQVESDILLLNQKNVFEHNKSTIHIDRDNKWVHKTYEFKISL